MEFSEINNIWVALWVGLITSPHCIIMCGPLAIAVLAKNNDQSPPLHKLQWFYHLGRILSFTTIGAIAGLIGVSITKLFQFSFITVFPWVLVVLLLLFGIAADRWIPKPKFGQKLFTRLSQTARSHKPTTAAVFLGLLTPFLPCGPLYMLLWTALLSSSPTFGASISFAFAVGTIPLLALTINSYHKLSPKINPIYIYRIQRILAIVAALLLAYRLLNVDGPLRMEFCCPW